MATAVAAAAAAAAVGGGPTQACMIGARACGTVYGAAAGNLPGHSTNWQPTRQIVLPISCPIVYGEGVLHPYLFNVSSHTLRYGVCVASVHESQWDQSPPATRLERPQFAPLQAASTE
jgi:hypothetical protein